MKRLLILLLAGCAHAAPAKPAAIVRMVPPAPVAHKPACIIPAPPTADDLSVAQAAHGLVGRDALLTDYAKRAFTAKRVCK